MNIVQMLSRDVTDKEQCHFVLISIKVPKKSQYIKTPQTNQYADSTTPAINKIVMLDILFCSDIMFTLYDVIVSWYER